MTRFKQSPTTSHSPKAPLLLTLTSPSYITTSSLLTLMYDLPMSEQTRTRYEIISQESGGESQVKTRQMVKAATAVTTGGSLLVLSGLTLTRTVIALTVATPLFVIFSPILVPAVIIVALIITGFLASGGFGIAAIHAFSWLYRHVTESGSKKIENARRMKLGSRAHDTKYDQSKIEVHQKQQKAY